MKRNLTITSLLGIIAILLGAFGAHSLKDKLPLETIQSFETGIRYQFYHVIVLLFVNTYSGFSSKMKNRISMVFFLAILLFSGSIYAITAGIEPKYIWFLTPMGGLLFIIGWIIMLFSFMKKS